MFKSKVPQNRKNKEEGEKPFWISFSDLMTALMVLFLLVMSVALLSVTKKVSEREKNINTCEGNIEKVIEKFNVENPNLNIKFSKSENSIELGTIATFLDNSNQLRIDQIIQLRSFVKKILPLIKVEGCSNVLKNIQVVGFTNKKGDYLLNLNLSLSRSHRLVCVLLQDQNSQERLFDKDELNLIKDYFLVSGFAFNESTGNNEKSYENDRRIELKLNYINVDEVKNKNSFRVENFGACHI